MFFLFSHHSPFSFFPVLIFDEDFLASRAGRGWSISPLFVALSTPATMQAYCFMYGVSYCCHPVPSLPDVGLLYKVDLPVPYSM